MNSKHTPGRIYIHKANGFASATTAFEFAKAIGGSNARKGDLADLERIFPIIQSMDLTHSEVRPDAAPDLLAALQSLVTLVRNQDVTVTRPGVDIESHLASARAAIARATN